MQNKRTQEKILWQLAKDGAELKAMVAQQAVAVRA